MEFFNFTKMFNITFLVYIIAVYLIYTDNIPTQLHNLLYADDDELNLMKLSWFLIILLLGTYLLMAKIINK